MPKTSRLSTDPVSRPGSLDQLATTFSPHPKLNPFATTTNLVCLLLEDPQTPQILRKHFEELFSEMGDLTGIRCTPPTSETIRRQLPLMLARATRMNLSVRGIEWAYWRFRKEGGAE